MIALVEIKLHCIRITYLLVWKFQNNQRLILESLFLVNMSLSINKTSKQHSFNGNRELSKFANAQTIKSGIQAYVS